MKSSHHTPMKFKNYQALEHLIEVPVLKCHLPHQALELPKKYLNRQAQNHWRLYLTQTGRI